MCDGGDHGLLHVGVRWQPGGRVARQLPPGVQEVLPLVVGLEGLHARLFRQRGDAVLCRPDELAAGLGDHALRHLVVERAAAHPVARLEHAHLVPSLRELARGGEAGEARAHDHHLDPALPALGRLGA